MNRDELLTKLAMELAEWPIDMPQPNLPGLWSCHHEWRCQARGDAKQIFGHDWLQRRQDLINCPPDSEAPEWAVSKAQDSDGIWHWLPHYSPTDLDYEEWTLEDTASFKYEIASKGTIVAGHDWRTTLTRIKRDDNTSTPEEDEEFERIQARQDADKPHEADARLLDAQLSDAMSKQPRYLDATGEDWIDEFARTATLDEFRGAMRFTIGKYNRRVGRKDEVLKEVRKMKDYCARWEAYELALLNQ